MTDNTNTQVKIIDLIDEIDKRIKEVDRELKRQNELIAWFTGKKQAKIMVIKVS